MKLLSSALVIASVWIGSVALADERTAEWDAARFDRQVAPLLAAHCLDCHNSSDNKGELDLTSRAAALKGGESGPAYTPGKLDESLLWQRVRDGEMPPDGELDDSAKELLRQWIAAGAVWGADPIDRFQHTSQRRAGYDWWSLQPIAAVEPPHVSDMNWPRGAIDRFVLAALERHELSPSPEASKAVLARRLYFDLTGLPPSPAEMSEFLADVSPDAYERLVDRLLASPRYGERWARHWLDVVRFAESNGFEYDEPRRNAWPYRDWVIAALNTDMPYDEFCRLQIAGDALRPGDPEALTAAAYLVAGPFDTPGQKQQSAAMRAVVRQDELEDAVGTTAQTFLGMTLNCARCHDHKFDPLRQTDYYRFAAALAGLRHGERDVASPDERAEHQRRQLAAREKARELAAQIEAIDAPVRKQISGSGEPAANQPLPIARWEFDDLRDSLGGMPITLHGGAAIREGALFLDGRDAFATTAPLAQPLAAKTLQAWVRLADLAQRGGAAMSLQSPDGQTFDAIVFGEQQPGAWQVGSNNFLRTRPLGGAPEQDAAQRVVRVTLTYDVDGAISAYRDGVAYGQAYRAGETARFAAGQAQVVFGLRHSPVAPDRLLDGAILKAELYDRALTPAEVAAIEPAVSAEQIVARLDSATARRRGLLVEDLRQVGRQLETSPERLIYTCVPSQPETTRLLRRGDTRLAAEVVSPGGIAAIRGPDADFGLAPDAPEAERRVALARWIAHPQNPLAPRVAVNRLWHYHFGVGLVDTPNDFGFNGGRPSHPELLDWLAGEFVRGGYRLKPLHRLIVTSAAYRQASVARGDALAIDRGNRLLWRRSPQRLEAESLRDAMLAAAGRLNHAGGGPGFRDYDEVNRAGTWSYIPADRTGAEFERRAIYRAVTRGGRGGLLDAFDCPDPSTTSPRRTVTTTPQQALALLNNSFVLRMGEALAERLRREAGDDEVAQVRQAVSIVYGRLPDGDEEAVLVELLHSEGAATLARVLFNSNEFLYVD